MVSRQETARALLTPGEVMQLPPTDELVLVSGMAPIRAQKLRYFADGNFTARVAPPPHLGATTYIGGPAARDDDWGRIARRPDARLERDGEADGEVVDGGLEQQRHPGLRHAGR
jgi:type IV secretion system protein VirD4